MRLIIALIITAIFIIPANAGFRGASGTTVYPNGLILAYGDPKPYKFSMSACFRKCDRDYMISTLEHGYCIANCYQEAREIERRDPGKGFDGGCRGDRYCRSERRKRN